MDNILSKLSFLAKNSPFVCERKKAQLLFGQSDVSIEANSAKNIVINFSFGI